MPEKDWPHVLKQSADGTPHGITDVGTVG
jgi:hypothetical protein